MNSTSRYLWFLTFLFLISFYLPAGNSYAQEVKPSTAEDDTLLAAARRYVNDVRFCALITVDSSGYPHVRTMDPFKPDKDWVVWFGTVPGSRKANEISHNPKVTLYYTRNKGEGYVSIIGTASLVNDQSVKDSLWKKEWNRFYKNKTDGYILIKVVPEKLEVIDYAHGVYGNKETLATPTVTF